MKFNYLAIGLLLALLLAIPAISAHEVGDYGFDIPDGYHIKNTSDDFVVLEGDNHHAISVSVINESSNKDALKHMLEMYSYDFLTEENYTKGDFVVEEDLYTQEYQRGVIYFCDNGDDLLVVDYKVSLNDDIDDSPVDVILDSLESIN